jgi:molecular chaperone DnaK
MSKTINFGIDLGTTNSLIACSRTGNIEIFKNPAGHKETLPSVVGFRNGRIIVGDKAREYIEKDAQNVFAAFKRKMGTGESFFVPSTAEFQTPIQLSSLVLKELKNFVYTGETLESVVITIPAAFDTVQSNATREAGLQAGFKEVILLQEPIAASLAFANKNDASQNVEGSWLVYDLGGGTFDVALVRFEEDEMRVIDHEGDNYLGGIDFDNLIIGRFIVPELSKLGSFGDLENELRSASGRYNKLYHVLLHKAEEAKIALSNQSQADIEFEITDAEGKDHEIFLTLRREVFEDMIADKIGFTADFIKKILERNLLTATDVREVIMIGGSTYIPYVRNHIKNALQIPVNCTVDPTTAVVVGAAYYAGNKTSQIAATPNTGQPVSQLGTELEIKMAYAKSTREKQELFTGAARFITTEKYYRIVRDDGGFDSGLKPLGERFSEVLNLLPDTANVFELKIYDGDQNLVPVTLPAITIVQGKFSIHGQPLPADICLEVDDESQNTTVLELIFEKNTILPARKTITKTAQRTIRRGTDDQLIINVLEGSRYATPRSNLPIGMIVLKGSDLERDIVRGSDIDLTIEISESRDVSINAYISMLEKDIKEVFNPTARHCNLLRLREEIQYLQRLATRKQDEFTQLESYELASQVNRISNELQQMDDRLSRLTEDDMSDEKYQAEEMKRRLAAQLDETGRDLELRMLREEYMEVKNGTKYYVDQSGNADLLRRFEDITRNEVELLANGSRLAIRRKQDELNRLSWDIRRRDISYMTALYLYYANLPDEEYNNVSQVHKLRQQGEQALTRRNVDELLSLVSQLYELKKVKNEEEPLRGTGLG